MKKLDNNNKVYIHNYCHAPKIANNKEESVQVIYLSKDIVSRQYYSKFESVKKLDIE